MPPRGTFFPLLAQARIKVKANSRLLYPPQKTCAPPLPSHPLIVIIFITTNLRELAGVGVERVVRADRLATARQPVGRVPGPGLACHPRLLDVTPPSEKRKSGMARSMTRSHLR